MKSNAFRRSLGIMVAALLFPPASLLPQSGLSHIRVVRLSYVDGTVAVKRANSSEWAKAMVNTPIEEGFALSTSASSYAEVEFENGSTARLGELSKLDFVQLALDADGNKLNGLTFDQGYATFHFVPEHKDVYTVKVADATITPNGKSEFRTDFNRDHLRVAVSGGSVEVAARTGSAKLGKDKVLEYNTLGAEESFNIQNGSSKDSWDKWVDARDRQSQLTLKSQAVAAHGPRYGWSDLGAYGEWADIPGFGYGWAPYAPMGWAPYSTGLWNWYPNFGWTWISGEPWGWLPYHYGLWNFDPSFGWFWMPGNLGAWSPAQVSWFTGPGWIGWAPYGYGFRRGINSVTAVPGGAVQSGQPISSQNVVRVPPGQSTPVKQPPFSPATPAMLSGVPLGTNVLLPGNMVNARVAGVQASVPPSASLAASAHTPVAGAMIEAPVVGHSASAPATVLMGGNPATEKALLDSHRSSLGRVFGGSQARPLQMRPGTTLGGHFSVGGRVGEFGAGSMSGVRDTPGGRVANAPMTSSSSRESSQPRPTVLSRAGSGGSGGMARGGGTGGTVPSGGGGISSGISSHSAGSGVSSSGHSSSGGHR